MIKSLLLPKDKFIEGGDGNVFSTIEKNTVVLAQDQTALNIFVESFMSVAKERKGDSVVYVNGGRQKLSMDLGLRKDIECGEQTIRCGAEPMIVYLAKHPHELWFVRKIVEKYAIAPFACFNGYGDHWQKGYDWLYRNICIGRYYIMNQEWNKQEED